MISKKEIEDKAKEFEINIANVERDYVFGWLLFGFFTASDLRHDIFLKGGNALRKGYFENTRFSSDLDLGIPGDISEDVLLEQINKVCGFIQEKAEVKFLRDENNIREKFQASEAPIPGLRVYEARVYFQDFYSNKDSIKLKISMDVTRFDKVLLPIQSVGLIHPYSDAREISCQIRCMKLEEIIATKLKCLLQRQHAPDLFDYVHSIRLIGGTLNKEEVVRVFVAKTIFGRNPHVLKEILHKTPFDYFIEYWDRTIVCAKQFVINAKEAIEYFLSDLDNLFAIYPNNGYNQFTYFNAELRVPIMKAGREQTLLKVVYNGVERMIEPYSLKYLQRKDGVQREYFYVFNCSGGDSPPGIRCFVPNGFQSIENTDVKFEPRNQIELSKAGEIQEKKYLFDPNRPDKAPRSKTKSLLKKSTHRPRYIYQCNYCGKKFSKVTRNSSLGQHKNKNGYRCGGRTGFYVDTKY